MAMPASGALDSLIGNEVAPDPTERAVAKGLVDLLANVPDGAGLQKLAELLVANGLESQFRSWIGSGPPMDVSAHDLKAIGTAEGSQWFNADWAERVRVAARLETTDDVYRCLARVLPKVIGAFTPRGVVPSNPVVEYGLESMRRQLAS
ncbi:MAG TPA: YidB family protein [Casimicrobiaceae bacterium]|nr:YidB family protein [Casimicrobiaceae bacterium]